MMEKKKRSKCLTSHRKVFTVNEANPKEKVIFDFLSTVYNESDIIKDILYDYIISNNLQTAQHSINIVQTLGKQSVSNSTVECKERVINSATYNNEEKRNSNNDFSINLDDINDKIIKVEHNPEDEVKAANNNALNFLKGQFT